MTDQSTQRPRALLLCGDLFFTLNLKHFLRLLEVNEIGIQFFEKLLHYPDEELALGNLNRDEVMSGYEEFKLAIGE